jgi:putative tryptophan/tyrosine transport system substrate-binding protein
MSRKNLISLAAILLLATIPIANAQQPEKIPQIGYLSSLSASSDSTRSGSFRQGLKELGYIDEKNVVIKYKFADGNLHRVPDLAGELVGLKVDVIVVGGSTATRAAKNGTKLIPIVMINVTDPVLLGFVASLARPGGNITGLTNLAPELGGKRLELLKEIAPQLSRVAVLGDPNSPAYGPQTNELDIAARALGLRLQLVEVRSPGDLEKAFSIIIKGRAGAVIGLQQPTIDILRERIMHLTTKNRLPAMYPNRENVEAGGLMSYAADIPTMFRRAAVYVDKILKGAKPADLPVEQPIKFEFVINLKAAKQIGLTIPPNVLARADRVIR